MNKADLTTAVAEKTGLSKKESERAISAMLEAVRDTFGEKPTQGWPLNYAPEDVGLGPYPRADDPL